jgi:hypothetical protein
MKIQATQSVQLPLLGTVDNLEIRVNSFLLFPTSIEVIWQVSGETTSKEGTITLPAELVSIWGTDDTLVKNYVLEQLGLVEDTTPDPIVEEPVEEPIIETPPTEETPQ